jgi:predicted SprT family Zn-dependent metalloprotease
MRDTQQERLYAWEEKWADWNRNTLSLSECRELSKWACRHFKLKIAPRVKQHMNKHLSYSISELCLISLRADQHKNRAIVLHETAHFIADELFGNKVEPHGQEFMGVYLHLLIKAEIAPTVALIASARAAGLKWKEVTPTMVKEE